LLQEVQNEILLTRKIS